MTRIRVTPSILRNAAQELTGVEERLRALGSETSRIAAGAPSYDGQFGPKVRAIAAEATARSQALANSLVNLSDELLSKAEAFEAADQETQAAFYRLTKMMRSWIEEASPVIELSDVQTPWLLRILSALMKPAPSAPQITVISTPTPTPTPTATPSTQSPDTSIYWGGLSEAQLAELQQDQGYKNDCGEYAIAAALNLIYGSNVQGTDVAAAANEITWPLPWTALRMWLDGPTTPQQQANIVNGIARQAGLSLTATATKGTTSDLVDYLSQPDSAVIVTIGWDNDNVPQIARNIDGGNRAGGGAPLGLNAHAMLLVVHDPNHLDWLGDPAPWGFVNSWEDGGDEIYWMPDTDFTQAWEHSIPTVGKNNIVVISSSPAQQITPTQIQTQTPTPVITPTPTPSPTPQPHPPPP